MLVLVALIGSLVWIICVDAIGRWFFGEVVFGTTVGRRVFAGAMVAGMVGTIYSAIRNSELWQVVRGYAQAKKERLCFIVEFK